MHRLDELGDADGAVLVRVEDAEGALHEEGVLRGDDLLELCDGELLPALAQVAAEDLLQVLDALFAQCGRLLDLRENLIGYFSSSFLEKV